jgi:hypothetical protein
MNNPEASFGASENRLSPLSPLHMWKGEAFRRGEAKVEASFEELTPLRLKEPTDERLFNAYGFFRAYFLAAVTPYALVVIMYRRFRSVAAQPVDGFGLNRAHLHAHPAPDAFVFVDDRFGNKNIAQDF